jgi:hypothetical protein|tara:strand:- start:355 stop:831 length:477 start_codon:yes stop_codon:yes gene_type:complete
MREINKIIIHCSDSEFGSKKLIDKWHKERGWDGCGYHYVITNGIDDYMVKYNKNHDGLVQEGRPIEKMGAHVKGHNKDSIGICLIGKSNFTPAQLYVSLPQLLRDLMYHFKITLDNVHGHNEYDPDKTCPNFFVGNLRLLMEGEFRGPEIDTGIVEGA